MKRSTILAAAFALAAAPASAQEALTIPPLVLDSHPSPSIWNGFYVGSGVSFTAIKGQKGGFGGDVFAGYDRKFSNNLVLGVRLDTGYTPFLTPFARLRGYDYALGSVKLGYDIGRVTPYVYAGGGFARATAISSESPDAGATMNGLFGQGPARGVTTFGGGVDYHITNDVTLGVSAGVVNGPGPNF